MRQRNLALRISTLVGALPAITVGAPPPDAISLVENGDARARSTAQTGTDARGRDCLWDNGLPDGVNGYSNATIGVFGARRTLLDDFTIPPGETWIIEDIHWEHFWTTFPPGSGLSMEMLFRVDAGGAPGAPITPILPITSYSEMATGVTWFDRPGAISWVEFEPAVLGPGIYWIEATIVGPENNFWLTSPVRDNECWVNYDDVVGLQPGSEIFEVTSGINFCLTGRVQGQLQILDAIPRTGGLGDRIRLVGRGFGTDADDLCVAVENGPDLLFMKTIEANGDTALVEIGNIPPDAVPGPIVVELGEGVVDTFDPVRPNIMSPADNWVWRRTTGEMGRSDFDFIPIPDPPPPPLTRWFYGSVEDGKIVIDIDGRWPPNATIFISARLLGPQADGAEFFNNLGNPFTFPTFYHTGAPALSCAFDICDHIRCALAQIQDIITDCIVEDLGNGRARIRICFEEGEVTSGTFIICINERAPVNRFGLEHFGFWRGEVRPAGENLVVFNIGQTGDDGVTIDLRDDALGIDIQTLPLQLMPGQAARAGAWGTFNGEPGQFLGTAGFREVGGVIEVSADYSALGARLVLIEAYDDGRLVGTDVVPGGDLVGRILPGPDGPPRCIGCGKLPPRPLPCFIARSDRDVFFESIGGKRFLGDELRLLAQDAQGEINSLKVFDIQGENLPEIVITGEDIVPLTCFADLDGSGAVDFGDILVVLREWGNKGGRADLDGSGVVDFGDILVILRDWGPCPGRVVIDDFFPKEDIQTGDMITILGAGFGNDPLDLCIATGRGDKGGGTLFQAVEVTDKAIQAMALGIGMGEAAAPLMVARGEGVAELLDLKLEGFEFPEPAIVWLGTFDPDDMFVAEANLTPQPNPAADIQYFDFDGQGGLTLDLQGVWETGEQFNVYLRAYCRLRRPDITIPTITITDPNPTRNKCALAICFAIVQAYSQQGIVITCNVVDGEITLNYPDCDIDGPDWRGGSNPSKVFRK